MQIVFLAQNYGETVFSAPKNGVASFLGQQNEKRKKNGVSTIYRRRCQRKMYFGSLEKIIRICQGSGHQNKNVTQKEIFKKYGKGLYGKEMKK